MLSYPISSYLLLSHPISESHWKRSLIGLNLDLSMSFSGQIHRRSSNTSGPNNQNHPDPGQHYHPNQNPGQNSIGVNSLTIDYFHPDETILTAIETLNYRVSIYDVILETGLDSQYVEAQLSLLLYKTKGKVIEK